MLIDRVFYLVWCGRLLKHSCRFTMVLLQGADEYGAAVKTALDAQNTNLGAFIVLARDVAKLSAQRGDVLEQQMGEAAEV